MKFNLASYLVISIIALLSSVHSLAADSGEGKHLYGMYCVQCHGSAGDGNGINALSMSVQPRSHIDTAEMSQRSDAELFKVIAEGGPAINKSILMPAWRDNMSEAQIQSLVEYLRVLCCSE